MPDNTDGRHVSVRNPGGDDETALLTRDKTVTPKQYRVVLFNDDYTTQEFVVFLLETLFHKSPAEAVQVMLKVHKEGRGIAGVYTREVAETKVLQVHELAKTEGYPLRSVMEEA